jgi:hypothetical protein
MGRSLPPMDDGTLERIAALACHFRLDAMAVFELACTPESLPRTADFSVRLESGDQLLDAGLLDNRAAHLFSWWSLERAAGRPGLGPLWLEFDLRRRGPGAPPVVCVQLISDGAAGARDELLADLLPRLGASNLVARQVAALLATLPPGAAPLYLFDLAARGREAIRLELCGLAPLAAEAWLRVAGLEDLGDLVRALLPYTGDGERPHLSFDLAADGALGRLGLENSYRRQPPAERRWSAHLVAWVARGRLDPVLAASLLGWVGADTRHNAPDWPADALPAGGWCVRALSHLKAAAEKGVPVELKAYLICQYLARGRAPSRAISSGSE